MESKMTQETHVAVELEEYPEEEVQGKLQKEEASYAFCDICFAENDNINNKTVALFICHDCKKYYCEKCSKGHDPSHSFVSKFVNGEAEEKMVEENIESFLTEMMNETKAERKEKLKIEDVGVCDYVDTKHRLDMTPLCFITGLCGYRSGDLKWWVVCDHANKCIKLFSLGMNKLHRYIRFKSYPYDVTEISIKQKPTNLDPASASIPHTSDTSLETKNKAFLAVTYPWNKQLLILDLNKRPAVNDQVIKMDKYCWAVEFNEDKLFTVCTETDRSSKTPYYVYRVSLDGAILNRFHTDIMCPSPSIHTGAPGPFIAVLNGNIYITDPNTHKVTCFNAEGYIMKELKIDGSMPVGTGVDRSSHKIYVCAQGRDKVYGMDSDLNGYKSVLERATRYIKNPAVFCYYGDKLYYSNDPFRSSYVSVVGLL